MCPAVMGKHAGTLNSFRFSEEELALLNRLAAEHGGQKAAVLAGRRALQGRVGVSDDELLGLIAKRLRRRWVPPAGEGRNLPDRLG